MLTDNEKRRIEFMEKEIEQNSGCHFLASGFLFWDKGKKPLHSGSFWRIIN